MVAVGEAISLSPLSRRFSLEGVGNRSGKAFRESQQQVLGTWLRKTSGPRPRPGSKSLLVVEVRGRCRELLQPTHFGGSPREG